MPALSRKLGPGVRSAITRSSVNPAEGRGWQSLRPPWQLGKRTTLANVETSLQARSGASSAIVKTSPTTPQRNNLGKCQNAPTSPIRNKLGHHQDFLGSLTKERPRQTPRHPSKPGQEQARPSPIPSWQPNLGVTSAFSNPFELGSRKIAGNNLDLASSQAAITEVPFAS